MWPNAWSEVVDTRRCGPPDVADRPEVSLSEFRSLLVEGPAVYGPPHGWTLLNLDTPVYADDSERLFEFPLLGRQVEVLAKPIYYDWTFSDGTAPFGSPLAGRPWPDYVHSHPFRVEGEARIFVTTTWEGYYRVVGSGQWSTIEGYATTLSTSAPFTVYSARARLVDGPLP